MKCNTLTLPENMDQETKSIYDYFCSENTKSIDNNDRDYVFKNFLDTLSENKLNISRIKYLLLPYSVGGNEQLKIWIETLKKSKNKKQQWSIINTVPLDLNFIEDCFSKFKLPIASKYFFKQSDIERQYSINSIGYFEEIFTSFLNNNLKSIDLHRYIKYTDFLANNLKNNNLTDYECSIIFQSFSKDCQDIEIHRGIASIFIDLKTVVSKEILIKVMETSIPDKKLTLLKLLAEIFKKKDSKYAFIKSIIKDGKQPEEAIQLYMDSKISCEITRLNEIFERFGNVTNELKICIKKDDLEEIKNTYIQILNQIKTENDSSILNTLSALKKRESVNLIKTISVIYFKVYEYFGYYPHDTQIITVLGLLKSYNSFKGTIAQVKTGEGKSLIVFMLTVIKCLENRSIDIITSSSYLAIRDYNKFKIILQEFNITSSHISKEHPTASDFNAQVLYGINTDFEFSIMFRDIYNLKNRIDWRDNKNERENDVVIVDEVDNLLIDKSCESARISIENKDKKIDYLRLIFNYINDNSIINPDLSKAKDYLKSCGAKMLEDSDLKVMINSAAYALFKLQENKNYIIKKVLDRHTGHTTTQIVIVDMENTGRLNENSRYSNYIHEFLELKHKLPVGSESLTAATLSHPVFFSKYKNIYGITGTLGSILEREEIKDLYNLDNFDVPYYHKSGLDQLEPIFVKSNLSLDSLKLDIKLNLNYLSSLLEILSCNENLNENHLLNIYNESITIKKANRPCLIICENIEFVQKLAKFFKNRELNDFLILSAAQDENEDFIIEKAGYPGIITIATNAAGRGTDINITEKSLENGGLHVILTYYPKNIKVEEQAFGRAARHGQPGSCILIINSIFDHVELIKNREENIKKDIAYRKYHADKDIIINNITITFFKCLRIWNEKVTDLFFDLHGDRILVNKNKLVDKIRIILKLEEKDEYFQVYSNVDEKLWLKNIYQELKEKIIYKWAEFNHSLENFQHPFTENGINLLGENYDNSKKDFSFTIQKKYQETFNSIEKILINPSEFFLDK
jgi:preprotein translocase subunit SecA